MKLIICLGVLMSVLLSGQTVLADIYSYRDENGVLYFTNVQRDTRYTLYMRIRDEEPTVYLEKYSNIINQAARRFDLNPSLIKAVIRAESAFDHMAVSKKGAMGLMQLMPATAAELKVNDPHNPEENIFGGTQYLSNMLKRFNNNIEHALAAYNAGPERVEQYKGVPPFRETKTFIQRVLTYQTEYEAGN